MEYRDIGENIRKYRNRLNLTQDELADKVGVTWEMISRYERGKSSPMNKLDKLSDSLGISLNDLISEEEKVTYEIPLFIKMPNSLIFDKKNTTLYYSCPKWIIKIDPEVFAIDLNIVERNEYRYGDTGYLFVSPNIEIKDSDLVLIVKNNNLQIEKLGHNSQQILGRVMMEEIIF